MKKDLFNLFNNVIMGIGCIILTTYLVKYFLWEDFDKDLAMRNILYALIFLVGISMPDILKKYFSLSKPLVFIFNMFWVCQIFLGSVGKLYITTNWWDCVMHAFAIVLVLVVSFELFDWFFELKLVKLKKPENIKQKLFYLGMLALLLALLWEGSEFILDRLFDMNLQRYKNPMTNDIYIGFQKYADTLKDFLVDIIAIVSFSFFRYYDLKHKDRLSRGFVITRIPHSKHKKKLVLE